MASVQDGGVVGDTKRTLGLGTSDPPIILEVPNLLLITREAQPPTVWDDAVWRFGVGQVALAATAAEFSSVAFLNPAGSGTAAVMKELRVILAAAQQFEVREGPITSFVSIGSTEWADFGKTGEPALRITSLSQAGVVAGSQLRYRLETSVESPEATLKAPFVIHPAQALIVNPTSQNVAVTIAGFFEQFRSSSQF